MRLFTWSSEAHFGSDSLKELRWPFLWNFGKSARFLKKFVKALSSSTRVCCKACDGVSANQGALPRPNVRGLRPQRVTLSVAVKDVAGNLVADLRREQFHLLDDDVEQGIDVFAEESLPLSLVLLTIDGARRTVRTREGYFSDR
jgi:hypothetical protein